MNGIRPKPPVSAACFFVTAFWPLVEAAALDWPQWRAPNRDGISAGTSRFPNWPREAEKQTRAVPVLANGRSQDDPVCLEVHWS